MASSIKISLLHYTVAFTCKSYHSYNVTFSYFYFLKWVHTYTLALQMTLVASHIIRYSCLIVMVLLFVWPPFGNVSTRTGPTTQKPLKSMTQGDSYWKWQRNQCRGSLQGLPFQQEEAYERHGPRSNCKSLYELIIWLMFTILISVHCHAQQVSTIKTSMT